MLAKHFDGVWDLHHRNWHVIPFWLASAHSQQAESVPFRRYFDPQTLNKYTEIWQRYIIFCLITYKNDKYDVQFTSEQEQCLDKVLQTLNDDGDAESIQASVQDLSAALIRHKDWNPKKSSLLYFADILGFDINDHRWKKPHEYTPTLAAILFCMRLIMLEYALPITKRDDPNTFERYDPLQLFRNVRDIWLVENEATPFGYLHKLLNYGFKAGKDGRGRTTCRWSHDGKILFFGGKAIYMKKWRDMVHKLLAELEQALSARLLFRTDRKLPSINLNPIIDNPDRKEAGYYFVKENPDEFTNGRERILDNLSKIPKKWKGLINEQGYIKAGIDEYEQWDREFREKLFQLMILTCGVSGRTKEMLGLTYINTTEKERDMYLEDLQFMLITSYHKSMNITDIPKVILFHSDSDDSGYHAFFLIESV